MTTTKRLALGTLMAATMIFGETQAMAKATTDAASTPAPAARTERRLADSVVVTPQGTPAQAAPAQPVAAAPVVQAPAQPVVAEPRTHKVVNADVQPNKNYMSTIAVSALMGGLAGGLIGGAIYYLGDQEHAMNIAYWAAGGVLVGTGVGVVQLAVQESRVSEATALRKLPTDPAPTFRLALFQTHF
ncbi:MAG TPA: hypothetical protein VIU64_23365 [Polyangia bacterium]